jgi:hypothetical protein
VSLQYLENLFEICNGVDKKKSGKIILDEEETEAHPDSSIPPNFVAGVINKNQGLILHQLIIDSSRIENAVEL